MKAKKRKTPDARTRARVGTKKLPHDRKLSGRREQSDFLRAAKTEKRESVVQTIGFLKLSTRIVHRHREFLAIVGGRFEHGFGHDRFDNRTESARTEFVFHRAINHIVEYLWLEGEFDPIEREEFGVLLRDGVFRLR